MVFRASSFSGTLPASSFPLLAPNGTQAAPSYSFSGSSNSGLYSGGAGSFSVSAANTDILTFVGTSTRWASGIAIGWSSGSSVSTGIDTGFSRLAAGSIAVGNGTAGDFTGTLKFTTLQLAGKASLYNGVTTAGWGVPAINGAGRTVGAVAAVPTVATYTVGAADGSFEVSANVLVTASTTHNFTVTVAYTDEGNTARTLTLNFSNLAGTISSPIINTGGAIPYEGVLMHIRCKAATAITIATTGTFTSVTYNVEGIIKQTA